MLKQRQIFEPPCCPNEACVNRLTPPARWFIRKGTFKIKWSKKKVQRFQCKNCKTKFSESSFKDTFGQHRPDLNSMIYRLYTSCTTMRRLAINLRCNRKTIVRKMHFLALKARKVHAWHVFTGRLATKIVLFDEMETHERTRLLPLSIPLAVCGRTGRILDVNVAQKVASGHLAAKSRAICGVREDTSFKMCADVLKTVKVAAGQRLSVVHTDQKPSYRTLVKGILPDAIHLAHNSKERRNQAAPDRSERHPMWWLGQACAMIRHDLSRMRRRTMVNTQAQYGLQRHLWLYVARRNRYSRHIDDNMFFVKTRR